MGGRAERKFRGVISVPLGVAILLLLAHWGIGWAMLSLDLMLFTRVDWTKPNALLVVNSTRCAVVGIQCLLVAPLLFEARKSPMRLTLFAIAAAIGFMLTAVGWQRVSHLLSDLTLT